MIFYMIQLNGYDFESFSRFNMFRMTSLLLFGDFNDFLKINYNNQDENLALSYLIYFIFLFAVVLL